MKESPSISRSGSHGERRCNNIERKNGRVIMCRPRDVGNCLLTASSGRLGTAQGACVRTAHLVGKKSGVRTVRASACKGGQLDACALRVGITRWRRALRVTKKVDDASSSTTLHLSASFPASSLSGAATQCDRKTTRASERAKEGGHCSGASPRMFVRAVPRSACSSSVHRQCCNRRTKVKVGAKRLWGDIVPARRRGRAIATKKTQRCAAHHTSRQEVRRVSPVVPSRGGSSTERGRDCKLRPP
jgi:hypothetical protein